MSERSDATWGDGAQLGPRRLDTREALGKLGDIGGHLAEVRVSIRIEQGPSRVRSSEQGEELCEPLGVLVKVDRRLVS